MSKPQMKRNVSIKYVAKDFSCLCFEGYKFFIMDKSEIHGEKNSYSSFKVLMDSINFCLVSKEFRIKAFTSKSTGKTYIKISFGKTVLCEALGYGEESAKEAAAKAVLDALRMKFYTIKMVKENQRSVLFITRESFMEVYGGQDQESTTSALSCLNDEDSLVGNAAKKRKKSSVKSRVHPVTDEIYMDSLAEMFSLQVLYVFEDYMNSGITGDLLFSSDFSEHEQQRIKSIARKKYGKVLDPKVEEDANGKKRMRFSKLLEPNILFDALSKAGGRTSKYQLYPPACTVRQW